MARLANAANLGFQPLNEQAATLIATYIADPYCQARMMDICAGEGVAAAIIADAAGIPAARRYFNELHDERASASRSRADHVVACNTLKGLQATKHAFQLGYVNPPFDDDGRVEGGGRLEPKFFRRMVEEGQWIQPGGLVVHVTPQDIFHRQECINYLARNFDDLRVYQLPDHIRRWREAVVFGLVRERQRTGIELKEQAATVKRMLHGMLPVLSVQATPLYTLPEPKALKGTPVWKDATPGTPTQAMHDVLAGKASAWQSSTHLQALAAMQRPTLHPLFPLTKPQAALRIADGQINGRELELFGELQLIKGSTEEEYTMWEESRDTDTSHVHERHMVKRRIPVVTTVDRRGKLRRYRGDSGIAQLMSNQAATTALLDAVTEAAPPKYAFDMDEMIATLLQSLQPGDGRSLPGQKPGLLPMQQHVVAAAVRAMTTYDAAWGGVPGTAFVAAEMGCGKTIIGLATAYVLWKMGKGASPKRAFTAIVSAPNHLIGDKQQVERYFSGNGKELPPWYAEWHLYLGASWSIQILESPSDVGAFFRAAERDPHTPRVGMIANSKLSLGSGVSPGVEDRSVDLKPGVDGHQAVLRLQRDAQIDNNELEAKRHDAYRKQKRKNQIVEAVATANADEAATESEATTPQWLATYRDRDGQERQIVLPRWKKQRDERLRHTFPAPRAGLCCPTCGRRVLETNGTPTTLRKLKQRGLSKVECVYCDERLGQMARERDNVADRKADLWTAEEWTSYAYDPVTGQRVIPWGDRPQSNPRYPLGVLIGHRYKGAVDVYLCDETHECKGLTTAIGRAFGAMVAASHYTVALTGTLFGGYAKNLYPLLLRLKNRLVRERWGWDGMDQFIREVGVIDEITRTVQRINEAGHYSGEPRVEQDVKERAGVTAELVSIMQNHAITVLLKHMGFRLVEYQEDLVTLDMPADIALHYSNLEANGKAIVSWGGNDGLSSYLQSTLSFPYQPWNPKTIASKKKAESFTPRCTYSPDLVLPHHEYLAEFCAERIKQGRRVLLYVEHTGGDDIMPDIARKITDLAHEEHGTTLKVGILRSTTCKPGERRQWFSEREADGTNVVLCNPRLVKTGLNLIGWPSICVVEPIYSLYDLSQAKRRAFRPTQTVDCEVVFVCYARSMSERAIRIIAQKAAAAAILSGDDLNNGLMEFDAGMSLLQELANLVTQEDSAPVAVPDVRALLQSGASALKADLESGAAGLLGAPQSITVPTTITPIPLALAVAMLSVHPEDSSGVLVDRNTSEQALIAEHDLITLETVTVRPRKRYGSTVETVVKQFAMAL